MHIRSDILHSKEHDQREALIRANLIMFNLPEDCACLSLEKYFFGRPEKYYNQRIFIQHSEFLLEEIKAHPIIEANITDLNIAFTTLNEINDSGHNEEAFGSSITNAPEQILLISQKVIPAYLRLSESCLSRFILPFATVQRLKRKVSLDKLDYYNRLEELKNTDFQNILEFADNTIRNAIAHGHIVLSEDSIEFKDKQKSRKITYSSFIKMYDALLDCCNALAFSFHVFFLQGSTVRIPIELSAQELRSRASKDWWKVAAALVTEYANGEQVVIYVRDSLRSGKKLMLEGVNTARLCQWLIPGYNRYFISLRSRKGPGWLDFNGSALEQLNTDPNFIATSNPPLQNLFFEHSLKIPIKLLKWHFILSGFRDAFRKGKKQYLEMIGGNPFFIRSLDFHRRKGKLAIHAKIVLPNCPDKDFIRKNRYAIFRRCVYFAHKKMNLFDWRRILRIGYIELSIYSNDFRVRRLDSFGLGEELICTLKLFRTKGIHIIDIIGGTPEQIGKVRIVWNRDSIVL